MKISRPKKCQHDRDMFECHPGAAMPNADDHYQTLVVWLNADGAASRSGEATTCVKLVFTREEAAKLAAIVIDVAERTKKWRADWLAEQVRKGR